MVYCNKPLHHRCRRSKINSVVISVAVPDIDPFSKHFIHLHRTILTVKRRQSTIVNPAKETVVKSPPQPRKPRSLPTPKRTQRLRSIKRNVTDVRVHV